MLGLEYYQEKKAVLKERSAMVDGAKHACRIAEDMTLACGVCYEPFENEHKPAVKLGPCPHM